MNIEHVKMVVSEFVVDGFDDFVAIVMQKIGTKSLEVAESCDGEEWIVRGTMTITVDGNKIVYPVGLFALKSREEAEAMIERFKETEVLFV